MEPTNGALAMDTPSPSTPDAAPDLGAPETLAGGGIRCVWCRQPATHRLRVRQRHGQWLVQPYCTTDLNWTLGQPIHRDMGWALAHDVEVERVDP